MGRSAYIIILFIFLSPAVLFAQFSEYSNEFLNIGAGTKGLAMGNAQVASVNDETAGYWNPAGLTGLKDISFSLMGANYFSGIGQYEYAALGIPIDDNKRALGISFLRFSVDDIPNTLFLVQPDGSINYNDVQSFSSADNAVLLSFAQKIKESESMNISVGFNAKIIYREVGSFANAWGFGIDAGLQAYGERWHAGIVAKDLTTTFNAWTFHFTDAQKQVLYLTDNAIPIKSTELTAPSIVIGGAYDIKINRSMSVSAEASFNVTFDGKRNTVISGNTISLDPHIGIEANINNVFFVRGGITNFQQALADGDTLNQKRVWIYQPSLGAGFKIGKVAVDYAFTNLANQSNPLYTNVLSLEFIIRNKKDGENKAPGTY
ncbi:MAG TPA: PorV/PorQ family protein [Ferruginibacter sp.]|nr:PorV/PorQ family protein [Ferruginibacter sp.]